MLCVRPMHMCGIHKGMVSLMCCNVTMLHISTVLKQINPWYHELTQQCTRALCHIKDLGKITVRTIITGGRLLQGGPKNAVTDSWLWFCQILTDLPNFFTELNWTDFIYWAHLQPWGAELLNKLYNNTMIQTIKND